MQEKTPQSSHTSSGADKRRYPRLPMAMKATLRGGILDNVPCVIRDFAPGGLLIKWRGDTGTQLFEQIESIEGKDFSVEFVVGIKGGDKKSYSIGLNVARLFKDGMGVSFVEPDQRVLNTLIKIAEITGRKAKKKLDKEVAEQANKAGQAENHKLIDLAVTNADSLEGKINNILALFFKKFHNRLLILMKGTLDEKDKFDFFSAQELLAEDLKGYRKSILQAVLGQLKDKDSQPWEKVFDASVEGNTLSLVDEKEFEAYLMLTEMISNVETEHKLLLFRATKGISNTYNIVIDEGSNPIGFSRLCRTIDEFLQYKTFGYASLKEAYGEMRDTLMPELVLLYDEITQGIDAVPEYKNSDSKEPVGQSDLNSIVETNPTSIISSDRALQGDRAHHEQGLTDSYSNPNQHSSHTSGYTSGHTNQTVNADGFPTLEGGSPLSPVIKGVEDLTHTLMALKSSLSVPDALDNLMQGNANNTSAQGVNSGISQSPQGATPGINHGTTPGYAQGAMSDATQAFDSTSTGVYIQQQDLLKLLDRIQQEDHQNWQNDNTIHDVQARLTPLLKEAQKNLNVEEQGAIGIVGGVLDFLREDQDLSHNVRQDLNRMQTVLYKQAVSGGGHFQEPSNPLRNVINILEKLDQRGANSNPESRQVINDLVGKVLALEGHDAGNFSQITNELNTLLEKQTSIYDQHIEQVVGQCEREQALVSNVNRESHVTESVNRSQVDRETNGEWDVWEQRAQKMNRGDTVLVDDGKGEKKHLSLAWTDDDASQFVFVDNQGEKAARMTRQELVVRLLKGSAEIADKDGQPVFDRAMVSSLFNAYDEVKDEIISDPDTGFLNDENFQLELNKIHKNALRDHSEHALFYLESMFNEFDNKEKSSIYMQYLSEQVKISFGEHCLVGRLNNNTIAIVAEYISREGAMILGETFFKALEEDVFVYEGTACESSVAVGISIIDSTIEDINELLFAAKSACEKSTELGDNQIWLVGDQDNSTAEQSLVDWTEWLDENGQDEAVVPLYGQTIELNSDSKSKPVLYLYSAVEENNHFFKPDRYIRASKDKDLIGKFEKQFFLSCLNWMIGNKKTVSLYRKCIINFSNSTINTKGLLEFIIKQFTESSVAPGKICFQIPGDLNTKENADVNRFIRTLSEFGCQFSLAQYGQDGLSQEMLKLPVNYVSVDPVLMNDVAKSAQSFGLIKSINDIAHMMDKKTIVVDSVKEDVLELLQEINIDYLPTEFDDQNDDQNNNLIPERLNPVSQEEFL